MNETNQTKYPRYIIYGITMMILYLLTVAPHGFPKIYGVSAIPIIPLVVFIGMFERDAVGAIFGFLGGLLLDISSVHIAGFSTIVLLLCGCACGLCIDLLMRNNLRSALMLTFISSFIYFTLYWLFFYLPLKNGALYAYLHFQIVQMLYTTLWIIPIYLILRRVLRRYRVNSGA